MPLRLNDLMSQTLQLAAISDDTDLPIAATIVRRDGKVVSQARNSVISSGDYTAHAELSAIRQLTSEYRGDGASELTLFASLEPCPMCAWGVRLAGIARVVFGAYNSQYGAAGSVFDLLRDTRYGRPVEVIGGVMSKECSLLLKNAFVEMRDNRSW